MRQPEGEISNVQVVGLNCVEYKSKAFSCTRYFSVNLIKISLTEPYFGCYVVCHNSFFSVFAGKLRAFLARLFCSDRQKSYESNSS